MATKKNLVIVESPAKAETLKKFLGSNYKITASMGHIRDLPKSQMGIDIENDFEPKYITIRGKGELLAKLRKDVKSANKVYLATDPDREGEAISWHLLHALKLDETKAKRITFNEITKTAVKNSIEKARKIDMDLVNAQQARRTLDRIVGYKISPLLWKKIKKGLSAGRVQSVALKIICDREEEIENFQPEEYWTIDTTLWANKNKFNARFYGINGTKLEPKSEEEVNEIIKNIKINQDKIKIDEVKLGTRIVNSQPPFTTSKLQQEASKLLGFASKKTMMVAQQLYEGIKIENEGTIGLVSYIRTDSVRISDEAYNQAKDFITSEYGDNFLSKERKKYKSKGKTQDAHEAIRPTYAIRTPDSIKSSLSNDQFKLYKLIWERFIASQMASSEYATVSVKISVDKYSLRSSGSKITFDGYLKVYKKNEDSQEEGTLPNLTEKSKLKLIETKGIQHFTQAPPRFTEAMLIKTLEEIGVGRPSTYAPTITTLTSRYYVTKEQKVFYSTELGEVVNNVLKSNFSNIVDTDFTAKMEEELDEIGEGKIEWKKVLRDFYPSFQEKLQEAEEKIDNIEIEDEKTDILCEKCGRNMVIKFGKFGKFLACPGFPECSNTKAFFEEAGVNCPECNGKVLIKKTKKGRKFFGCENNPECEFMSWNLPTGDKCPKCDSYLVEKGTKNARISCSNNECDYHTTKKIKEE